MPDDPAEILATFTQLMQREGALSLERNPEGVYRVTVPGRKAVAQGVTLGEALRALAALLEAAG